MRLTSVSSLALAAAFFLAPTAIAQTPTLPAAAPVPSGVGGYVLNFRDADIREVAEQVASITGRTLVLDPAISGKVTVITNDPVNAEGVWALFQTALRGNGLVAVKAGQIWRVIPLAGAAPSAGVGQAGAADFVTRVIPFSAMSAEAASRVLRPLVNSSGSLDFVPNANVVVITDYADNVRRIESLARALDSNGAGGAVEVIPLKHAPVADLARSIERVAGGADAANGGVAPRISIDERSNTLLVRGSAESLAEVRRLVGALDTPGGAAPTTRLFRLANSDAEFVAEVLSGLTGQSRAVTNPVARSLSGTRSAPVSMGDGASPAAIGGVAPVSAATQSGGAGGSMFGSDVSIQPAVEINGVVVRAGPSDMAQIEALIGDLDVRRPQVLIEAAIVEITGSSAETLGAQLGLGGNVEEGALAASSFSLSGPSLKAILTALGEPGSQALTPEGLTVGASTGDGFSILVQALSQSSKANLLSTPSVMTLDNRSAAIVVGQNVPFRTGSFTSVGNSRDPFTTIEREDVGVTLEVLPRLYDGDVVRLEVRQEVSSLVNTTVAGASDLITNQRSIETTVLADNGQTIVLGGLITDDRQATRSRTPVLGHIPVIGRLFGASQETTTRRTLFVFLRPTILRDADDASTAAAQRYERLRDSETAQDAIKLLPKDPEPRLPPDIKDAY